MRLQRGLRHSTNRPSLTRSGWSTSPGYVLATRERTGATVLLVTHDLAEALTLADRLVLMSGAPGSVQEVIDIAAPHPRDLSHPALAELMRKLEAHLEAEAVLSEFTADERGRMLANA